MRHPRLAASPRADREIHQRVLATGETNEAPAVHVSVDDLAASTRFISTLFGAAPTVIKDD